MQLNRVKTKNSSSSLDLENHEESLDEFIANMKTINRLKWKFMSPFQIAMIPVEYILKMFDISGLKLDTYDDHDHDSPYYYLDGLYRLDRRHKDNEWLRQIYYVTRNHVRYHMMSKTVKTKKLDVA